MSKLQEALKSAEFTDEQIAAVEKVMTEQKLYSLCQRCEFDHPDSHDL